MSDAISLGSRAFMDMDCMMGEPPECAKKGGFIEYEGGNAFCALCGQTPNLGPVFDTFPEFENDKIIKRELLSKTGAKRGRDKSLGKLFGDSRYDPVSGTWKLTELGLVKKFQFSANAEAETRRFYDQMLSENYHLGGTGLEALVYAAAYHGAHYDYNFLSMDKVVDGNSTMKKKANSLIKRARREGLIERVVRDPVTILQSALSKNASSKPVEDLAIKYAKMYIPNLRPGIHASGALYKAMKTVGNGGEKRVSQEEIGERFNMGRKSVSQGYRAINKTLTPKTNPGHTPDVGLTGEQVRLLRLLR